MDRHGTFVARLLDSSLRGLAAEIAVRHRRRLQERGLEMPAASIDTLIADTEARLLVLGEALATARPALFVEELEWARSACLARDVGETGLAVNVACLREVLFAELPPSTHDALRATLEPAERAFERPARRLEGWLDRDGPQARRLGPILLAILETRREDALALLCAPLAEGRTPLEIECELVGPLLAEIGAMWQRGELHVHEEHYASRIVEEALVRMRLAARPAPSNGKSVIVGSVAGNLHDLGARIVADHFSADGWRTLQLGANMPGEDLGRAAVDFDADLIAVSVTLASQVRRTAALIEEVRAFCEGSAPPLIVGGPPFRLVPDLWRVVGADGSADSAAGAVSEGRRLVG